MNNTELKKLLKEGSIILTKKEYEKAKEFFDEILDTYPECAQAYLGLLMAELKVNSFVELENSSTPIDSSCNFKRALNFGDDAFKAKLSSILEKNRKKIEISKIKAESPTEEPPNKPEESISDKTSEKEPEPVTNEPPNQENTDNTKTDLSESKDEDNNQSSNIESNCEQTNESQMVTEDENENKTEIEKETETATEKETDTDTEANPKTVTETELKSEAGSESQSESEENKEKQPQKSGKKILTALYIMAVIGIGYYASNEISKNAPEHPNSVEPIVTQTSQKPDTQEEIITLANADFSKPMEFTLSDTSFVMMPCMGGSFLMGSPENELGREINEKQHKVSVTQPFFIGKYEVTQELYFSVMQENPSRYKGSDKPVDSVNWLMAKEFCSKLNKITRKTRPEGYVFDLPTEIQWEYACRGGVESAIYNGKNLTNAEDDCESLNEVAWYSFNAMGSTHPVGQKQPNSLGLYDMLGNVSEWCNDHYAESYDENGNNNPNTESTDSTRVSKGGNWIKLPSGCRSASRNSVYETEAAICQGFRIVLTLSNK